MKKPTFELDYDNLLGHLAQDVADKLEEQTGSALNIIEFVENEVDLGIELTTQQRTILKAYYNLELTDEETSVLEYWKLSGRSTWDAGQTYQVLVIQSGRRSGKSSIAAIIAVYEFYQLSKLASPQSYYRISRSTPISILTLATTALQGKKTIFKNVVGVIRNCKYFKQLEEQGKLFIGKEEIAYEEKLLYIYSGNSQSAAQVGGTLKAMIMDEVARFKDLDGDSNALELWSNLGIATTTFGKDARRVAISSAWYEGDAIELLYEASKNDPTSLGIDTKSWELNPIHAARDNPVVASEYATDPIKAALEFENIRPSAVSAFLDALEVKTAFTGRSEIEAERYETEENGFRLVKLRIDSIHPYDGVSVLHIDPSVNSDSYGLALGHLSKDQKQRQIVIIDALLAWEPTYNSQVSITNVQDVILDIHQVRPIRKLTADHYNSAETIQRLRQQGISCDVEYFSNTAQLAMYDLVRMLLHEQRLILPADSAWTPLALSELCRVQLIRGRKIEHPKNGSKDLADAIAAVCWRLAGSLLMHSEGASPKLANSSTQPQPAVQTTSWQAGEARQRIMQNLRGRERWLQRQAQKRF